MKIKEPIETLKKCIREEIKTKLTEAYGKILSDLEKSGDIMPDEHLRLEQKENDLIEEATKWLLFPYS